MRKIFSILFFLCISLTAFFIYIVFFWHVESFSLQQRVYEKRIQNFTLIFAETLAGIETDMYDALESLEIRDYFINLARGKGRARPDEKLSIRYYFLENVNVFDTKGNLMYSFSEEAHLGQEQLSIFGSFFLYNQKQIGLRLPILGASGAVEASILFQFSLRKLMAEVYSKIVPEFNEENIFIYRYAYVYNELQLVNKVRSFLNLEKLVDSSYEVLQTNILENVQNIDGARTFFAKQLPEGIIIGFYYSRLYFGIPWLSLMLFFLFFVSLGFMYLMTFLYREQERAELQSFLSLKDILFQQKKRKAMDMQVETGHSFSEKGQAAHLGAAFKSPDDKALQKEARKTKGKEEEEKKKASSPKPLKKAIKEKEKSASSKIRKPKAFPAKEFEEIAKKIIKSKKLLRSREKLLTLQSLLDFPVSMAMVLHEQRKEDRRFFSALEYFGISYKSSNAFILQEGHEILAALLKGEGKLLETKSSKFLKKHFYANELRKSTHLAFVPLGFNTRKNVQTILVFA